MATITIYRENVWAGCGRINSDGQIEDCPAILGPNQDASEETYEAIEDAITAEPQDADRYTGTGEVVRPDGVYSWTIAREPMYRIYWVRKGYTMPACPRDKLPEEAQQVMGDDPDAESWSLDDGSVVERVDT